ncbi:DUF5686 family protein [Siphonobacter sp. SORGH_AS_0500]|uniref:DUF5686 and carboxypeptidase-like regulatory domain-containing protein n=1 Tax=Siphonobacter sp. SORGH_AS_0500 TaxID=1864824 RepID=UPI002861D300|nr:DUF5686 family protein [Siphonobacter sp. SORGH_AS_0500]MDR6193464.1 hypothetical protein [Siphonobacter sp. SORGH_AS_0500]
MFSLFSKGIFILCAFCVPSVAFGQYLIKGRVTDASSGEPIPFANVALRGKAIGTTTNFEGYYSFKTSQLSDSLIATNIGYRMRSKALQTQVTEQEINIQLEPGTAQLREVVIHAGENPAYAIIRNARSQFKHRQPVEAYEYTSYTKIELDVDNVSEKFRKRRIVRKMTEAIEQAEFLAGEDGQPILPMFVSETFSRFYYLHSPELRKEHILKTATKGVGVKDGNFISQITGGSFLQSLNFTHNYITFLGKDLLSPMGEHWKSTYDFYLEDTLAVGNEVCYAIEFKPRRSSDLAFTGKIYIDTTRYALREVEATIGKEANLNFIDKLKIDQELTMVVNGADSTWLPNKTRFMIDVAQLTNKSAGMLAKFDLYNQDFVLNKKHPLSFYNPNLEVAEDFKEVTPEFWAKIRPENLSSEDLLARKLIDTLQNLPIVRTYVDVAELISTGWKKYPYVEFGPYLYSAAWNRIEGLRLRMGVRTNSDFSKHWILRGHLAYGTLDQRFKYSGEVNYLFSRKRWTVAGIRYYHDLERIGLTPDKIGDNKLFYAFTRFGKVRGSYMQTDYELFFKSDVIRNLTLSGSIDNRKYEPQFPFFYKTAPHLGENSPRQTNFYDTFVTLEARYAKNEQYLMDGNERITLGTKRIPVISFRYVRGFAGLVHGNFNYHRFQLSAYQTLQMGLWGRSNYSFSMGYTPSVVPPMLLFPHLGNPTWLFNRNAFNLMDFFEFVSDRYVSLQFNHSFEGLLTNRIPVIQKLKLRSFMLFNALVGQQSLQNHEFIDHHKLPSRTHYDYGSLDPSIPYMEIGYGIDNIFKFIKITALHRLTYRDTRSQNFAIKASAHFGF